MPYDQTVHRVELIYQEEILACRGKSAVDININRATVLKYLLKYIAGISVMVVLYRIYTKRALNNLPWNRVEGQRA